MNTTSKIRVLLVDDHPLVLHTLRGLLQAYPNIEVVGQATDGEESIARVRQLKPDIVLMDIFMQKMDGVTASRLIKAEFPEVIVLGLSAKAKHYDIYAMERAGAFEVLTKEQAVLDLYPAIQRALAAS
jgi:DNA-binding NarL/FixJ family response regulator